jgi:hypothetical protein
MTLWIQYIFGIQMHHEVMQAFFFNFYVFKGEGVAFAYSVNFPRTAETISMNLGTNEVLMIPYKCRCISK